METGHNGEAKMYSADGVHRCSEYATLKAVDESGKLALIATKAFVQCSRDMNELGGGVYCIGIPAYPSRYYDT